MKAIITACMLQNAAVCKTFEITVSWMTTEQQCVSAIADKAKEYPEWRVVKKECRPA